MIRVNVIFCKLLLLADTAINEKVQRKLMESLDLLDLTCAFCNTKGLLEKHGTYQRWVIERDRGEVVKTLLTIRRVQCTECGTTHAILNIFLIPYEQHSLLFILKALAEYYVGRKSVSRICIDYDISERTFRKWRKLYEQNRKLWMSHVKKLLDAMDVSMDNSKGNVISFLLKEENTIVKVNESLECFLENVHHSFLQRHPEPVKYRQEEESVLYFFQWPTQPCLL